MFVEEYMFNLRESMNGTIPNNNRKQYIRAFMNNTFSASTAYCKLYFMVENYRNNALGSKEDYLKVSYAKAAIGYE